MSTPDQVRDSSDPGDDVQRRFRYQNTIGAIAAVGLLLEGADSKEVFSELHEDILVRKKNGRFVGRQIKTRLVHVGPFKANDPEILGAISRFAKKEVEFAGRFERFSIESNVGFWREKKNGSNLPMILSEATACTDPNSAPPALKKFLQSIAELADVSQENVLSCLKKTIFDESLPSLDDAEPRLIEELNRCLDLKGRSHIELGRVARGLVADVSRAASLANDSGLKNYFACCDDPAATSEAEIIAGKRFTQEMVRASIAQHLGPEQLLATWSQDTVASLPKGMKKLERKMAAGGIPFDNIEVARDQKYSAEILFTGWLNKYGPEEANRRYQHFRALVRSETQEAFDSAKSPTEVFGMKLLDEIQRRLKARHDHDVQALFFCQREHLLGVAGILTEECKLWWSQKFPIPEGDA